MSQLAGIERNISVVHASAKEALGKIGPIAAHVIITALKDQDIDIRRYALGKIGLEPNEVKEVKSVLIPAIKDEE